MNQPPLEHYRWATPRTRSIACRIPTPAFVPYIPRWHRKPCPRESGHGTGCPICQCWVRSTEGRLEHEGQNCVNKTLRVCSIFENGIVNVMCSKFIHSGMESYSNTRKPKIHAKKLLQDNSVHTECVSVPGCTELSYNNYSHELISLGLFCSLNVTMFISSCTE